MKRKRDTRDLRTRTTVQNVSKISSRDFNNIFLDFCMNYLVLSKYTSRNI